MGIIRELPTAVVNQIAAGEVVERPASVVKELLENAVDAGASRVDLSVERGGKDLIRVADDGKGMARDDLPLAFRPHATSKLAEADDLFRIGTLGFRGEALAAIAEISRVRCQTRREEDPVGSELSIDGGVAGPIRDCGGGRGTTIEVRNLFFNTPVRRTFLKSDSTEAGHVGEMFARVALAHPTVHFTLRSAGKVVHELPAVTGLKERIAVFFGQELAQSLLWVEGRLDALHLWGYVAHPSQSRASNKGQYLFVGGRHIRDRSLGHALTEAYRGLLMVGRNPVAFLHLEMPPDEVDVNVHPSKIEVRFRDSHRIYSHLLATVRKTFLASDLHARLQSPAARADDAGHAPPAGPGDDDEPFRLPSAPARRQEVAAWFAPPPGGGAVGGGGFVGGGTAPEFRAYPTPGYAGGPGVESTYRAPVVPPPPAGSASTFDEFGAGPEAPAGPDPSDPAQAPPAARPREPARLPGRALQVHDTYLVAETEEGMVVIDQHALHERILYEELKARVVRGGVEAQGLLVPEPVELTGAEAAAVLDHRELLGRLGLGVEPVGGDPGLLTSTPAMLAKVAPDRLLRDLADHLRSKPHSPTPDALLEDVLNMIACKAAIKANQRLTPEEVSALLDRRHLAANTHHCPHGRPTALVFTKAELEKQFGRLG